MSRANTLVCPGGEMDHAMQLIFTPMMWRFIEQRKGGDGSRVAMHSMKEFTTMHSNDGDAGGTTLGQPDAREHHG